MWVLLGLNYDTVENEPFVYFVGIFDDFEKAKLEREQQIISKNIRSRHDFFIKAVVVNTGHEYRWSYSEEGDITPY